MMYNQKMVCAIRANGKILREFGEAVFLPFGTEYSILLKNLNDVRVVARIFIDGIDVTKGGLVIGPKKEVDFERSLANGSMDKGNKFKFIERSGAVEKHRGIKLEDGIVRIEYEFEEPAAWRPSWCSLTNDVHIGSLYSNYGTGNNPLAGEPHVTSSVHDSNMKGTLRSATRRVDTSAKPNVMIYTASAQSTVPQNETGVTVNGSESYQQFTVSAWFPTESTTHTIVLNLFGETEDNKAIREPITTKTKQECTSCGHKEKATAKFCSLCGTGLEVFA